MPLFMMLARLVFIKFLIHVSKAYISKFLIMHLSVHYKSFINNHRFLIYLLCPIVTTKHFIRITLLKILAQSYSNISISDIFNTGC